MKESFHPLSTKILSAKALLIPALISSSNMAINETCFSVGTIATLNVISQIIIVLIIEWAIDKLIKNINENNRFKAKNKLIESRLMLNQMIKSHTNNPHINTDTMQKATNKLNAIERKIIELS